MADPQRPNLLIGVTGTATDIGKTWVGCRLVVELRQRGRTVAARKPAQSFEVDDPTTDADELARASDEDTFVVCPPHRRYEVAMAPPMAADALGRDRITIDQLVGEVRSSWGGRASDVGLVETAGGVRSPIAHDGDAIDLLGALDIDLVLLVADPGLGTINSIRLTLDALDTLTRPTVIIFNRWDETNDLHRRNLEWCLRDPVVGRASIVTSVPLLADLIVERSPTHCIDCGRSSCTGQCASDPLEAPHFCPLCGRAVAVTIIPTGWTTKCRVHGEVGHSI